LHATGGKEPERTNWMRHFIAPSLRSFEVLLAGFEQTPFAIGETPSLADICLIPQLYNANRWGVDYGNCARIKAVEAACGSVSAFKAAYPD
jgi:maleylacetoacetate isomerase